MALGIILLLTGALVGYASASCPTVDIGYDPNAVMGAGKDLSSHSWEYGTASEALLELYNPEYAVFASGAFPNGGLPKVDQNIPALSFAKPHITTTGDTLADGDGAAGDPASLGVSAILLGREYWGAATRQKNHLLNNVPRFANGAISQRESNREAWADFLYMVPPFLAYVGVRDNNLDLVRQAVQQCGYYHDILQVNGGAYSHIVPGPTGNNDRGLWSTGNAWAVMGMARVLATIEHWSGASSLTNERSELTSWVKQIIDGARNAGRDSNGLVRNYFNDNSWFGETSGTALLAAAVYRMAVLAPYTFNRSGGYLQWADDSRGAVAAHVNNGILQPAVNPLGWKDPTPYEKGSPEGQSFGAMLYAAWRDCKCVGKC